jgi:hypothetical protein
LKSELSEQIFDQRRLAEAVQQDVRSAPASARAMPSPMPLVDPVTTADQRWSDRDVVVIAV